MKRRGFLVGLAGLAGLAASSSSASARGPIEEMLLDPRIGRWSDEFDLQGGKTSREGSDSPILSVESLGFTEEAVKEYEYIVAQGGWPFVSGVQTLRLGMESPTIPVLRERLQICGDLKSNSGNPQVFDSWVEAAVRRFQSRHGIAQDGIANRQVFSAMNVSARTRLEQLRKNLRRFGSEKNLPGKGRLVVANIPGAQIEASENGRIVSRHVGIVGKIDRQTPTLSSKIHEIILNPYWTSPKSIIRKDIIPYVRDDPDYLSHYRIRIFNEATGEEIDPSAIDWSTEEAVRYRFTQEPGKINAMASTKINFANPYSVYMHDTPEKSLFGESERFISSGCVRVQNVRDLTAWILRDTPKWRRGQIESVIASGENVSVRVRNPVPVRFAYVTAWSSRRDAAQFREDIYRRDGLGA